MLFSYNWLQSYFQKKLPKPKELVELLTMHSFEIEKMEKSGNPARNASLRLRSDAGGDWIFDIDILANRVADCCGHIGIAREIGAILEMTTKGCHPERSEESRGITTRPFDETLRLGSGRHCGVDLKIEVKDKNACPRYTAVVITDVKIGESPKYIQERLRICGLRPINNIVDAMNYVMLETGQPLHAFDFDKVKSVKSKIQNPNYSKQNPKSKIQNLKKIIIRRARKGERITSLDDKEYELDKDILVIADEDDALAIAGIKGGKKAEIDKNTKTIILEAANFEPMVIRRTRQKLNLQTDASFRFEHNLDPNLTELSINRAIDLIQRTATNRCQISKITDVYPKKVLPKKIKLDLHYMEKLLGAKIPEKQIKEILKSLGSKFQVLPPQPRQGGARGGTKFQVEVPTFRRDVSIQEDLIEEIARIYGYDKIPLVLPQGILIPPEKNYEIFWKNVIKSILKEIGFSEVYNYSFVSPKQVSTLSLLQSELIEVQNPVSNEQKYMRPSLMPNLLGNIERNLKNFDSVKMFETGRVYKNKFKVQSSKFKIIEEKTMLGGIITVKDSDEGFYEMKGIIDLLFNKLGISDIRYDSCEQKLRCAEIKIGSQKIGFLGEVSPKIIGFDLDFEKLVKLCSEEHQYQVISAYPSAVRDLAVLVPKEVKVVDVMNKINVVGKELVRDVDIFDIYAGSELPEGKKNFAFHIIYQAQDRTLATKEIDEAHQRIMNELEKDIEWQVRR